MSTRAFSHEEDEVIENLYVNDNLSSIKIAAIYGVDKATVLESLKRSGVDRRSLRSFSEEEEMEIALQYKNGHSASSISQKRNVSVGAIFSALKRQGIQSRGNNKIGELEDRKILEIYLGGKTIKEIASIYQCGRKAIDTSLDRTNAKFKKEKLQKETERKIIQLYQDGYSLQDVANRIDGYTSGGSISRVLERNGIKRRGLRAYSLDQSIFDAIDSEESAYFLGFVYADGCVTQRTQIKVALGHKDIGHLRKLQAFYKTDMPIAEYANSCQLNISSERIANSLSAMGIVPRRGNFHLTLPFLSPQLEHHFIRGLFDGDGCISPNHHHIVFTNQRDILEWVREKMIVNAGANCNKIRSRPNTYEVSWGGKEIAPRILKYMYRDATIWLDRKYEIAKNYL